MLPRWYFAFAWAWMIIIGGLIITPGGVWCIVCGAVSAPGYIGRPATIVIGVVSIAVGIIGLANLKGIGAPARS